MNIRHSIPFGLIALMMAAISLSETFPSFPGGETDRATLRTRERVEELYLSGAYERAYFIYRKELAPRGDKYAQYMIGYMHFTGAGVPEGPAVALAWYRLAAERGEPAIELARDELQKTLSPTQIATAEELLAELKSELSDRVLIYELVQRDLDLLRDRAGRINSMGASPVLIIDRRYGYISGAQYNQIIKKRLAVRVKYLKSHFEIIDLDALETTELAEIESEIKELTAENDKR